MQGQRTRPSWQRSPKSGAHRRQLLMRSLSQAAQTWACSWRSSNCRAGPAGHPSDQQQGSCLGGRYAFDNASSTMRAMEGPHASAQAQYDGQMTPSLYSTTAWDVCYMFHCLAFLLSSLCSAPVAATLAAPAMPLHDVVIGTGCLACFWQALWVIRSMQHQKGHARLGQGMYRPPSRAQISYC